MAAVEWQDLVGVEDRCGALIEGEDGSVYLTGWWDQSEHPNYGYDILTLNTGGPGYNADWLTLEPGDTIYLVTSNSIYWDQGEIVILEEWPEDVIRLAFNGSSEADRNFSNPQPYGVFQLIWSYTLDGDDTGLGTLTSIHSSQLFYQYNRYFELYDIRSSRGGVESPTRGDAWMAFEGVGT